jgi:uncharacterized Zn-finger protein
MTKHLEALKSAKSSFDFFGNKQPKCPHCGSNYGISNNDAWDLYDANDSHSVECPSCNLEFNVVTRCSYSFDTEEQEDESESVDLTATPTPPEGK